jgi:hypothetical protein
VFSAKDYVPNPDKWIKFFKKEAERKFEPKTWGKTIIPIEGNKPKTVSTGRLKIEAVTPAQQTVDQAKSELLRKETAPLRNKRSSKSRKLNSVTSVTQRQTYGGGNIFNKPRQTPAKKVVSNWDSSGF